MRKSIRAVLMLLLILAMFGCDTDKDKPARIDQLHMDATRENSPAPAEPEADVPVLPLKEYVELPAKHYVEAIEALSDSELRVKLTDMQTDIETNRSYWALIDMNTKTITKTDDIVEEMPPGNWEVESPTGKWIAEWDMNTPGIWGIATDTGDKTQWTDSDGDRNPLWLSDGSGFYYLHSTGVNLGDGAGFEATLAHYDIATRKSTVLSYEKGFWGGLRWLVPDESIVASNGFDDVIGLKIIHLPDGTEKQIVDTSNLDYLDYAIHKEAGQLLITDYGKFAWYDRKGDIANQLEWPVELDESTRKNPNYVEGGNPYEQPFYESGVNGGRVGPHGLQFSPNGKHLSYLLGAIGESIDDKVSGVKLVISNTDGTDPALVLDDYVRMDRDYVWSPSSKRIFIAFSTEAARERAYVGWISIK
ncbi:hypothetical protein J4772_24065 [Cohnella sp. LGH]|uniref:hypothetical protein n=1 Tax=Cohnella sp. LGH TaxID=1619153 RepID=UPI001ADD175E|nr:hypothetical protein [Cohnella sp. LGH]QTH40634.1 hypothetical protein J4772_24065 [Cohnella sp. LGH]